MYGDPVMPSPIHRLRLTVLPGRFAVCRLEPSSPLSPTITAASWVSVTRTADELSVVCAEDDVPAGARCERGWRRVEVDGPLPFTATGIMASLAAPLADADVSLFAVSTFDTDYLLVKDAQLERAAEALEAAGHEVAR